MSDNHIIVLVGPGGVGKDTIARALCRTEPARFYFGVSWTSREPREGEDASAYNFVTRDEFERGIANDELLEWAEYGGNLYGTPKPREDDERILVLVLETVGAENVKKMYGDDALIIQVVASDAVCYERMIERGDTPAAAGYRVGAAIGERRACQAIADEAIRNVGNLNFAVRQVRGAAVRAGFIRVGD